MISIAKFVSGIFNPFIIPFAAFLILFLFTYLRIMPFQYKLIVLGIVYCFTILMPVITIYLFKRINKWSSEDMTERKNLFIPYLLTIIAYIFCLILMYRLHIPPYMSGIILGSIIAMFIGIVINLKWKISGHMIGIGGVVGGLVSFGFIFSYNPVWWLCGFILIAGILGTSRIILARHTLGQIVTGFLLGFGSIVFAILYY